ncbi:hypothetical protein ACSFCW_26545 [Yokenella regensburgei]|uniref:hypothetical protein n=1 Tax=Yokenella regensburgei TaxID=158877 RepID=UPI003ED8761D
MPYIHERKETATPVSDNDQCDGLSASQALSLQAEAAPLPGAPSSPSAGPDAGGDTDDLFTYLRDAHLAEAQEFRRKGHNARIPAFDPASVNPLRQALAGARESKVLPPAMAGLFDDNWRQQQLGDLARFTTRLSDNAPRWIKHELGAIHGDPKYAADNRAAAQRLAERLESALQTLKNVVDVLFPAGDAAVMPDGDIVRLTGILLSEAKEDRNIASALPATASGFFRELAEYFTSLGSQLSSAFSQDDCTLFAPDPASVRRLRDAVSGARALLNITVSTESPFSIPWALEKLNAIEGFAGRLSEENVQRWVRHERAIKNANIYPSLLMPLNAVVQTLTDITEELLSPDRTSEFSTFGVVQKIVESQAVIVRDIAAQRQGPSADFFRDVWLFLEKLNREMKDVSVSQQFSTYGWFDKKGSQAAILLTATSTIAYGLHGKLQEFVQPFRPEIASARLTAESIARSILWSWQHTAIKTRDASQALYTKTEALQPIKDRILPAPTLPDRENSGNTGAAAGRAAVQQPTPDRPEQEKSAGALGEKMAALNRLLNSDITRARNLLARQGVTQEDVTRTLIKQRFAVLKMTHEHLTNTTATYLKTLNELLPGFAEELAAASRALDKAITAAGNGEPNYREAKERSEKALLLATQVEMGLSAAAASLTGRPLDKYARGARLARHWARVSLENTPQDWVPPDAAQVHALLRKHHLTDDVLSAGDPQGYLFATRLAAEFENARNGELRTPMSPEQYAALEKGLVEYLVKWGQQRASSGGARLVVTLSFDAPGLVIGLSALTGIALRTVKDVIRIPYSVHQLKKLTMPGEDIPFRAINSLLKKKLKQFGFRLAMAPLAGTLKFAAGSAITAGAGLHNRELNENSFEAVYERVAEGKQSEKIKMASAGQMLTDAILSGATTAGYKGAYRALVTGVSASDSGNSTEGTASAEALSVGHAPGVQGTMVPSDKERRAMTGEAAGQTFLLADEAEAGRESSDREETRAGRSRGKRSTVTQNARAGESGGQRLRADQMNFSPDEAWNTFTDDKKRTTYLYAIKQVLRQIENDQSLPQGVRNNAWLARIGAPLVVPVDIAGYEINNTFLLPDAPGAKSGVLVQLGSALPYYYVSEGEDLQDTIKWGFPHNEKQYRPKNISFVMVNELGGGWEDNSDNAEGFLNGLRRGSYEFNYYFNRNNPSEVDIASLSSALMTNLENDYKLKGRVLENRMLITRATLGSQIPDPEVTATQQQYQLKITWNNLTPAEYLRSFSRPFSTLSGQTQLLVSDITGQTLQQTEINVDKAEYIGSWIDISVGAVTAFTPAGIVLGSSQAAAEIAADVTEGVPPDPLAVAALVVGSIPGGRIGTRIGKFSRVGGASMKYALMIADKTIDLATVERSIQYAAETGEPLAIYQALLDCGMSVKQSYEMGRHISSQMKLSKPLEASASLESLQTVESLSPEYTVEYNLPVRTFKIGNNALQGRIDAGEIRISRDNGVSWQKGSRLHLLAYRLQNAGGGHQLPEADPSKHTNAPEAGTPDRAGAGEPLQTGKAFGEDLDFPFIDNKPGETEKALQRLLFSTGPHAGKLKRFRDNPDLFCYEAMLETFNILQAQGQNPRVVGMLVYKNPGDIAPANHFAVRIHKDGADYVIDPTIRQFDPGLPDSATVLPYAEWESVMKKTVGTGADRFILLKVFDGPLSARRVVSDIPSSLGKYYQNAMFEDNDVNILKVNNKFKNSIILELKSRNNALRKSEASGENPEFILKDIINLKKLKVRFNLLSPAEISPSKKTGKYLKGISSCYIFDNSEIAAIEAGHDSKDIKTTVTGRHYLKIRKNAWLKVEQGVNENFMRVIHGGQKEIIIRFDEIKKRWRLSSSEKMAEEMTASPVAGTVLPTPPVAAASRHSDVDNMTRASSSHSTVVRPPEISFQTTRHHIAINRTSKFILKKLYKEQKIQVFDANKGEYVNSSDFILSCTDFTYKTVSKTLPATALNASVGNMKKNLDVLTNALSHYPGSDKAEITGNLSIVKHALDDIRKNNVPADNASVQDTTITPGDSVSDISSDFIPDVRSYALINKGVSPGATNTLYALLNVQYNISNSEILVRYITSHPYVVVNKFPDFRSYLIEQGLVSADTLEFYNIRNVARFLGYSALQSEIKYYESLPDVRIKWISFSGANPIMQQMGYLLEEASSIFSRRKYSAD